MRIGRASVDGRERHVRELSDGWVVIADPYAALAASAQPADVGPRGDGPLLPPSTPAVVVGIAQNGPSHASPVQAWGDTRLAVSFHRLAMPDGHTYSLDQFKGLDQIGETGLKDEVNRHYWQVFGASLAIGALSGLAQYNTRGGFDAYTFGDAYRQAAGASLASSSTRVLDRYLNVLPTVTIREGFRIKVYLTNDLALPAYDEAGRGGAQ